jgi:hypothetical protein
MNEKPKKYVHRDSGEVFELSIGKRLDENNEMADVFCLRNKQHYFECRTQDELNKFFVKL